MDARRLPTDSPSSSAGELLKPQKLTATNAHNLQKHVKASSPSPPDVQFLPLALLYITNGVFFGLFLSVAYFLLHRWREKVRTSTPLHVVTVSEIAAIVSLIASVIYLLGFLRTKGIIAFTIYFSSSTKS